MTRFLFKILLFVLLLFAGSSFGYESNLPECPSSGYFHNCYGSFTHNNGAKYVGEWKNNKQHGQGATTWPNGGKYVGEWVDNKMHGQGTYTYADGDKYVGEYQAGKRHGQGTFIWANGEKYLGEWKDGKQHGQGTTTWPNGAKYVGELKNGKKHGQGSFTWPDGAKYVGEYQAGKRHGQGTITYAGGGKYVGGFQDDKQNRFGVYQFPRGENSGDKLFGYSVDNEWVHYLYVARNGAAKFGDNWGGERLNNNVHNVLPSLKMFFNGFDKETRKTIQYVLSKEGLYNSSIDGKWGRNTLNAIAEFAVLYVKTIELDRPQAIGEVFNGIITVAENRFKPNQDNFVGQDDNQVVAASSGTGFFISKNGHIVTNNHVIKGCNEVQALFNGRRLEAQIIAKDNLNDLAVLRVDQKPPHIFPLSSGNPKLLQDIYVAGYPFGKFMSSSIKVTKGIVSALAGLGDNYSEIQIDAAIQPGNSGGPIVDEFGNIVGVAVAKLDIKKVIEDYGVIPENVNFGIKVSTLKALLEGNSINFTSANGAQINKTELGNNLTKGTVQLSCWMTVAQIRKMLNKKTFFKEFE